MAVSIGTNSNANDWGHFESSGLGSLIPGQAQNLSGNDLRFVLNTNKTIAKDQTVTIDKALIITAQDANAPVSSWLSPAYVTINLKGVEENQAPKIKSVEATTTSDGKSSITVHWNNPQEYDKVEIKVFNKNNPSTYGCSNEDDTNALDRRHCWGTGASLSSNDIDPIINKPYTQINTSTPFSYIVTGLSPSTTYDVLVRGYLKTH